MATVIVIPQTYLRMGRKSFQRTLPLANLVPAGAQLGADFGLLAVWRREFEPWLKIRLETAGRALEDGNDGDAAYQRICAHTKWDPSRLPIPRTTHVAKAAFLKRTAELSLRLEILTDHRRLAELANQLAQSETPDAGLSVVIRFYTFDGRSIVAGPYTDEVQLQFSPLKMIPAFLGFVALDLGNFSSSVACLRNGENSHRDIRLAMRVTDQTTLEQSATSQTSLVRLDDLTTWYANRASSQAAPTRILPDPAFPQDDKSGVMSWVIGDVVRTGPLERQISGAKRMLTRVDADTATVKIPLDHRRVFIEEQDSVPPSQEIVQVRYRFPAELLASSLLQQFIQATRFGNDQPAGWPQHLAVTYPTSYAPAEIHALRCAVQRAWLRALNENQAPTPSTSTTDTPDERTRQRIVTALQRNFDPSRRANLGDAFQEQDELISLMIDEATAASFHYLFRFAAEAVGGLLGFRLKYPDGMNLLLYDCGGGTTDIALVQAKVEGAGSNCLTLNVLGRSGVRHFGGDDITAAIARLLKAKLTAACLKQRENINITPSNVVEATTPEARLNNAREVQRFLAAVAAKDPQSKYVPTRFNPSDVSPESAPFRMNALMLWSWAEQLKQKIGLVLEGKDSKPLPPLRKVNLGMIFGEDSFTRESGVLNAAILNEALGPKAATDKSFGNDLLKVSISREEIDAMIARQVIRTLTCCKSLIQKKLPGDRRKVAPVVHKVAVTGGAARYPLIQEMLKERLNVSDLEHEHWFHYEEADLKNVVAKGAVQALAALNAGIERFRFDSRMADSLPFDVAYKSWKVNDFIPIYHLQERYSTLEEVTVPLAEALKDEPNKELQKQFPLFRRYAGDGEQLDTADRNLPIFEDGDELLRLEQQKGYELFLIFQFDSQIVDHVTVYYNRETHTFGARDRAGNEGKPFAPETDSLRSRAPHERGTL